MNKSRSSMLLAVHVVCYSDLNWKEGNMQDGPFMIGDIEVTDELLEKVEAYVQEEIEMMHQPTVLH